MSAEIQCNSVSTTKKSKRKLEVENERPKEREILKLVRRNLQRMRQGADGPMRPIEDNYAQTKVDIEVPQKSAKELLRKIILERKRRYLENKKDLYINQKLWRPW